MNKTVKDSSRYATESLIFLGMIAFYVVLARHAVGICNIFALNAERVQYQHSLELAGGVILCVVGVALALLKQARLGLFARLEIVVGFCSAILATGKVVQFNDGSVEMQTSQVLVLVSSLYLITRGVDHLMKVPRMKFWNAFSAETPNRIAELEARVAELEKALAAQSSGFHFTAAPNSAATSDKPSSINRK